MTNVVNIRDYHPKPKPKSMDDITMDMWAALTALWGFPSRDCEVVNLPKRGNTPNNVNG